MRRRSGVLKWAVSIVVGVACAAIITGVLRVIGFELTPGSVLAFVIAYKAAKIWDETTIDVEFKEE